jgi:hypothetical protein
MTKPVVTIRSHIAKDFEDQCQALYDQGYKLINADTAISPSTVDYPDETFWSAIFALEAVLPKSSSVTFVNKGKV